MVSGTVFSKEDGLPLIGASIFYDGTTIGTVTDDNGYFTLKAKGRLNNTLVVQYLGYETIYLDNLGSAKVRIGMEEKATQLEGVVLETDIWSRRKKERIFIREFLGEYHNCEILNVDDVKLYYKRSDKTLYAFSDKPIKILNKRLHYEIVYHLNGFETKFKDNSGTDVSVLSTYFSGVSKFTDQKPNFDSNKITNLRNGEFKDSVFHFFRAMYQSTIEEEGFELYDRKGFPIKVEQAYDMKMEDGLMVVVQNYNKVVIKHGKERSFITSIENPFAIDIHGVFYPPKRILIGGAMSKKRVGQMLPSNFEIRQ